MSRSPRKPPPERERCLLCGRPIGPGPVAAASESEGESGSAQPGACSRCGYRVWFDARRRDGEVEIRLLHGVQSAEMLQLLGTSLAKLGAPRVVLDFRGLDRLSSKALGKLISLRKKAEASPVALGIRNMHADLFEVFKITRLDQSFSIERE